MVNGRPAIRPGWRQWLAGPMARFGANLAARPRAWALAATFAAAILIGLLAERPVDPDYADATAYLKAAFHLANHGTFSESGEFGPPSPQIGREPGYAVFLAALMRIDPTFGGFTPACFRDNDVCRVRYRVPQWANAALVAVSGLLMFLAMRLLSGNLWAAWIAAGHLWLNHEFQDGLFYLISDYLAVFLMALTALLTAWAWRRREVAWVAPAVTFAALTLTKAIFLYGALALAGLALVAAAIASEARRRVLSALVVVVAVYAVGVGGWMLRNQVVAGMFAVTQTRAGIALSTREVLNHMSPAQYGGAFVYWTRGAGDSWAKRLFAKEVWEPFELYAPDGFYLRGQLGYPRRVEALMRVEGLSRRAAQEIIDRRLVSEILDNLPVYAATTLPVLYRGIWIDEFIVFSFPALVWLCLWALRRRRWEVLALVLPGLFSLTFYPLISLNIPRYQMTTLPALALATGFALPVFAAWVRRRIRRAQGR